jgi:hypothetical protein
MFGLFKKETAEEKLEKKRQQLLEESFKISKIDRKKSDEKFAEAEKISEQIAALNK